MFSTIRLGIALAGTALVAYSFGRVHGNNFMMETYREGFYNKFKEALDESGKEYEELCEEQGKLHAKTGDYANLDEVAYTAKNDELIDKLDRARAQMGVYQDLVDTFTKKA